MSTKPATVPTWATNANYAASTQPWAATATKVQPPSAVQTEGINPEDPIVAQYENWWKNKVGEWITYFNSNEALPITNLPTFHLVNGTAWAISSSPLYIESAGSSTILVPIPTRAGDRITDIVLSVFGNGVTDTVFTVQYSPATPGSTSVALYGPVTDTNRAASWSSISLAGLGSFTAHTMVESEALFLTIAPNAAAYRVGSIKPIIDRP